MKINWAIEISDSALFVIFAALLVFFYIQKNGVSISEMHTALTFDSNWPNLPHTSDTESGQKNPWEL